MIVVLVLDALGEDSSGLIGQFKDRRLIYKESFGIESAWASFIV